MEELIKEAENTFRENFKPETWFERCINLNWQSQVESDNDFFQQSKITDPKLIRRGINSILAEIYLCKKLGWKLEFLNSSPGIYSFEALLEMTKRASELYKKRVWINFGILSASDLDNLRPYIKGICAPLETINKGVYKRLNPISIKEYMIMLSEARGLKKAVTINLGIGESLGDISLLHSFIETHSIDKVNFYPVIPIKGMHYKRNPDSEYYARWVAETRLRFPKLKIAVGTWVDRVAEIGLLLRAGANSVTKFPAIKLFNSEQAKIIEEESEVAGRKFLGTLTDLSYLDDLQVEDDLKEKLENYIELMKQDKSQ